MSKQHLAIAVLFVLILTACATGSDSSQNSLMMSSGKECPRGIEVKIDGKAIPITAPNPFHGFTNPSLKIKDGFFMIELNTLEVGFLELLDFDEKNLIPSSYDGSEFQLRLSYSPYSTTNCTNINHQNTSKLIIEKYAVSDRKFAGCFFGKLDCDGKLVEINASVSGKVN